MEQHQSRRGKVPGNATRKKNALTEEFNGFAKSVEARLYACIKGEEHIARIVKVPKFASTIESKVFARSVTVHRYANTKSTRHFVLIVEGPRLRCANTADGNIVVTIVRTLRNPKNNQLFLDGSLLLAKQQRRIMPNLSSA